MIKKALLYRLFRLGAVPKTLRRFLEPEGITVIDEGIRGWFITRHVNGPGKIFRGRSEGFSGWLAITSQRVMCYTYGKRQINISVKDPKIAELFVNVPHEHMLSVSFESSAFRKGWEGVIEFQFNTEKALVFRDALVTIGARQGTAPDRLHSRQ